MSRVALAAAACATAACSTPDPAKEIAVHDVETYWIVDSTVGETVYIAPAVRFRLTNRAATRSVQATATFRRIGETATWGSDWQQVSSPSKPLAIGRDTLVVMRSDGRYHSTGAPESFFAHELFKDAQVEVFVRVGSSGWVKAAAADIERRVGTKALEPSEPKP